MAKKKRKKPVAVHNRPKFKKLRIALDLKKSSGRENSTHSNAKN